MQGEIAMRGVVTKRGRKTIDPFSVPLDDFPDPNPLFPHTPRDGRSSGTVGFWGGLAGTLISALVFASAIAYGMNDLGDNVVLTFPFIIFGPFSLVVMLVCLPVWRSERLWRSARIVPGMVGAVDVGLFNQESLRPDNEDAMSLAFHVSTHAMPAIAPPLALLAMAMTATRYEVNWVEHGQRRRARIFLGFEGTHLEESRVVWLLLPDKGKPRAALFAASWSPPVHRMPPEVALWFLRAWQNATPDDSETLTDLRNAARST
jgi:hypothetical protein